jgi:poly(A) polymerase
MTRSTQMMEITDPLLVRIGAIADANDVEAYVVGGYVRDRFLGREVKDIDIVIVGDGIRFARMVAREFGHSDIVVFEKFGTAMLPLEDRKIEFVAAREESYTHDSRKPVVKHTSLASDLSRRDFTVNTLAVGLHKACFGTLSDLYDGVHDIHQKILRTPLDPEKTFDDDPLRMMRAVRFASQLQFSIDPPAMAAISSMASRIGIVSMERIVDEFLKILLSPKPSVGLDLLYATGLAEHIFPELVAMVGVDQRNDYHHKDVFLHTLKVVDTISMGTDNLWLRFVGLVHDIAKPRTKAFKEGIGWTFHGHEEVGARMMKSIFRRMRLPMDKLPYVEKLVRLHLRPMALVNEEVTDSAIRRVMFEGGHDIDDLMLLCRADITSQNPQRVARFMQNYEHVIEKMKEVEEKDRIRNWQPPIRGDEIMQICGIGPSPLVGVLKKKIEDAILDGDIPNEHEAALQFLLSIKDQIISEYSQN